MGKNLSSLFLSKEVIIALILGLAILGYGALSYQGKMENIKYQQEKAAQEQQTEQEKIKMEQEKAEREETTKESREKNLNDCLENAFKNYKSTWDLNCEKQGQEEGCSLSHTFASELDKDYGENQEMCIKLYGD